MHGSTFQTQKKAVQITSLLLILLIFSSLMTSCSTKVEPSSVSGFKLNTYITITVYDKVDRSVLDKCLELCDSYENMFSRTIPESTLSQVNNHKTTEIPPELAELLQYGFKYSELSNGSFDFTIGSVSSLWDFTSDSPKVPDATAIRSGLAYVDYKNVSLSKKSDDTGDYSVSIPEGTIIDLGALAKGYIADKIKEYLVSAGVRSAVINLGGNILCIGNKPDGSVFNIGVRKPFSDSSDILLTLKINGQSVVSSGTYERCFTQDGILYHHILNPKTGYPYDNDLTSVTIISDKSVEGDCLSTTCFTLGLNEGLRLIESLDGIEAVFITKDGTIHYSSGASQYIK